MGLVLHNYLPSTASRVLLQDKSFKGVEVDLYPRIENSSLSWRSLIEESGTSDTGIVRDLVCDVAEEMEIYLDLKVPLGGEIESRDYVEELCSELESNVIQRISVISRNHSFLKLLPHSMRKGPICADIIDECGPYLRRLGASLMVTAAVNVDKRMICDLNSSDVRVVLFPQTTRDRFDEAILLSPYRVMADADSATLAIDAIRYHEEFPTLE
jgi:hypothetical protein